MPGKYIADLRIHTCVLYYICWCQGFQAFKQVAENQTNALDQKNSESTCKCGLFIFLQGLQRGGEERATNIQGDYSLAARETVGHIGIHRGTNSALKRAKYDLYRLVLTDAVRTLNEVYNRGTFW